MYDTYLNILPDDAAELVAYIGEENIFKLVFEDVLFNKLYKSPFREDTRAGCWFSKISRNSKLYFVDFADPNKTHYDCINAVQAKFNLDYHEALEFLKSKFKTVDISTLSQGEPTNPVDVTSLIREENTRRALIQISIREWSNEDRLYWSAYGISKQNLIDDRVVPIDLYSVMGNDGLWKSYRPLSITYGYLFPDNRIKIYTPNPINTAKWITNCTANDIGNIHNIDERGDTLIISKSYKDCRVLRNLNYKNTIWFQNEVTTPSVETLIELCVRYRKVVIFFDNDSTGIAKATQLSNFLNGFFSDKSVSITINSEYNTKDISDTYHKYGESIARRAVESLLANIQ